MKHLYYFIWALLAKKHNFFVWLFTPLVRTIHRIQKKKEKDFRKWKNDYSRGILEFPGGINDWFAYAFMLAFIYAILLSFLFYFDEYTMPFLASDFLFIGSFIVIALLSYYWIYFRNINWLKERIEKESKKYYIK